MINNTVVFFVFLFFVFFKFVDMSDVYTYNVLWVYVTHLCYRWRIKKE